MSEQNEKTKVIFRKWSNGDIIAIFPEEVGTNSPYTCDSYEHIGQHGACDPAIIRDTKPAKESEYSDLHRELTGRGYDLHIQKRVNRNALDVRRTKLESYT